VYGNRRADMSSGMAHHLPPACSRHARYQNAQARQQAFRAQLARYDIPPSLLKEVTAERYTSSLLPNRSAQPRAYGALQERAADFREPARKAYVNTQHSDARRRMRCSDATQAR